MNAIRMLTQHHRKVETLFKRFDCAGSAGRKRIAEKIFEELDIYKKLEENDLYPAIQSTGEQGATLIRCAEKENQAVDELIARLRQLSPHTNEYKTDFATLRADVEQHVGEEERQMFPYAQRVLGAHNLVRIGHQMADRQRALTRPGLLSNAIERVKSLMIQAFDVMGETVSF